MKSHSFLKVHETAVEKILSTMKPSGTVWGVFQQWVAWLTLSLALMALLIIWMKPLPDLDCMGLRQWSYIVFCILGSAYCAWGSIASSLPSFEPKTRHKVAVPILFSILFLLPFLLFPFKSAGLSLFEVIQQGWACFKCVSIVSLFPYVILGFLVSRNASFHAGWSGAWAGLSAFLLSSATAQIHCQIWESGHMVTAHILPIALIVFFSVLIGFWWFSRWVRL